MATVENDTIWPQLSMKVLALEKPLSVSMTRVSNQPSSLPVSQFSGGMIQIYFS